MSSSLRSKVQTLASSSYQVPWCVSLVDGPNFVCVCNRSSKEEDCLQPGGH